MESKKDTKYLNSLMRIKEKDCQKLIKTFQDRPLPSTIYNIGLIVMAPDSQKDDFITIFNKCCYGNLYVYVAKNPKTEYIESLTYFKKYRDIDLICIISDLNDDMTLRASTGSNIRMMWDREDEYPYILSIHPNKTPMNLCHLFANRCVETIDEGINNVIIPIQAKLKLELDNSLDLVSNIFKMSIEKKCEEIVQREKIINKRYKNVIDSENQYGILIKICELSLDKLLKTRLEKLNEWNRLLLIEKK